MHLDEMLLYVFSLTLCWFTIFGSLSKDKMQNYKQKICIKVTPIELKIIFWLGNLSGPHSSWFEYPNMTDNNSADMFIHTFLIFFVTFLQKTTTTAHCVLSLVSGPDKKGYDLLARTEKLLFFIMWTEKFNNINSMLHCNILSSLWSDCSGLYLINSEIFFKLSRRILTFTKHTVALTSVQKGLYVFVFPQGRIVQIMSQCVHGVLKDRKDKKTFEYRQINENKVWILNPKISNF